MSDWKPKSRSNRVVTRNLIISATAVFDPERRENLTRSNFFDLCTLINTCALFDELSTLGHPSQQTNTKPYLFNRFRTLNDIFNFDSVLIGPGDRKSIVDMAVPEGLPVATTEPLKKHIRRALESEVVEWPDYPRDLDEGKKLADLGSAGGEDYRVDFFYRSFAYIGYSRSLGVPLVPDAVRQAGMPSLQPPSDLAEQVLSVQQEVTENKVVALTGGGLEVPPFAALAFRETQSDISKLPAAIQNVRKRMAPIRKYLRSVADAKDFGVYQNRLQTLMPQRMTASQLKQLDRKTKDLLDDIAKDAIGLPSIVLKWRPVLSVAEGVYHLINGLLAPHREALDLAWQGVELVVDGTDPELAHLFKGNPLAEMHSVTWDLNAWNGSEINLPKLLGTIDDDGMLDKRPAHRTSDGRLKSPFPE